MKNALGQFYGKEIYACDFFGTRLNLNPFTFSLCHEAQVGDQVLGKIKDLSPERYYDALKELAVRNQNEKAPCRKCDKCKIRNYYFMPIRYVTVCTSEHCNSNCVYCGSHFGEKGTGYDPIPYLEAFHQKGLFSENCYFDWGGGEPTLNPWFEETVQWLNVHGYSQRINTNGIIYSKETESALQKGKTNLRISVDAGSEECFRFMKGHCAYTEVWDHIRRYCKVSNEVYVKYNICNYNSSYEEIEQFLQKCKSADVKNVIIDAEVSSYQPEKNAGPFYFTETEFNTAHYLEKRAKEEGFHVDISGYAFSVREEFDDSGKIALPKVYYDNLDYDICSHGIKVQTFPSVGYMIEHIKKQQYPVTIWGMGAVGKQIMKLLKEHSISISAVIDKNPSLHEAGTIMSPEEYFSRFIDSQVILAGKYWKEMLCEINQFQYSNSGIYYLSDYHFRLPENT